MMFRIINSLIVLSIIFTSTEVYAQQVPKLRIDPAQAYGGNVSEFFDNVEYIPLETNKESLFGDIYQLIVTDSSYVVADLDTRHILFFSLDGKFKKKLNLYSRIYYDKIEKEIAVLESASSDFTNISIAKYSLLGEKLSSHVRRYSRNNNYNNGFLREAFF